MTTGVIGQECKAYYNSGTHAAPSWVEIKRGVDFTLNLGKGEAETSRRESGWEFKRGALKQASVDFGYRYKRGVDTVFDALFDSWANGTAVEFAIMDQIITASGAQGLRAFCEVFSSNMDQPLADGVVVQITASPTDHEEAAALIEPDWYIVT